MKLLMLAVGAFLLAYSFADIGAGSRGHIDSTLVKRGGTLKLRAGAPLVDPGVAYTVSSGMLLDVTCARLFNYPDVEGSAGTRVIKEVVRTWKMSPDGKTYTFDLKRSFTFHTGQRVTARSFADAFNRDANKKMNSPAKQYMHEIVGAEAVMEGKATSISGVKVLRPYRLQIRLTEPVGDLLPRLTLVAFCPILPNTPIDPNGIDDPPGSGPYYVAERIPDNRVVLERNRY